MNKQIKNKQIENKKNIDQPNHVINNSMSCIDLIFCTNQNVISNYGVDVSMFKKCHHNIIHGKIDIHVHLPPVYVHEVWHYNKANVENIKKAVTQFNWNRSFENISVIVTISKFWKNQKNVQA